MITITANKEEFDQTVKEQDYFASFKGHKILEGLNEQQEKAVKSLNGETLVIAGAGSGKTAVLTRRCAFLILNGVKPGSILSLTFTNKAAKEMNERIRKILAENEIFLPNVPSWTNDYENTPLFCTFHSLGVRILREFGEKIGIKPDFNILDTDETLKQIKLIIKELNIDPKVLTPNYALNFINLCKQELLTSKNSKKIDKDYLQPFHDIYRKYEEICRQNNVIDFNDLILLPYLILRDNSDVQLICQQRWLHIQIDEFQDTNTAQFELVYLLYPNKD